MYKFPDVPSPKADVHEIADFIEIKCIQNRSVSAREVSSSLDILTDHDYRDGVPEDEELEPKIADTLNEIDRRYLFCGTKYPFKVVRHGHVVTLSLAVDEIIREIYTFLLFATRLDMSNQRIQNDIDGTSLFEKLSEYVGKHYFGERAESYLFGTAFRENNFENKITSLIEQMGEGRGFKNPDETFSNMHKDDRLDVVVWKSFSDGSFGKLIGFGQCKTGTHWKNYLTILHPDSFCRKWFRDQPTVNPVRLFFISESILRNRWYEHASDGGILFDRCRIMDYLPIKEPPPFLSQIRAWNMGVTETVLKKF
jgi:hypothetical protein